ncbi:uncharacterized protein [Panulirus ornatus]|uniref:uncharacterized protein n=1 Tax=Panulirus ornatus TaxID=150431 RepID=UPI003A8AFC3E
MWLCEKVSKVGLVAVTLCLLCYVYVHHLQQLLTPDMHGSGVVAVEREQEEFQPSSCPMQEHCPRGAAALPVSIRRRFAFTLAQVQRLISRLSGTKATVDAKWALVLGSLMNELAPRLATDNSSTWDHSAILPGMKPKPFPPNRTRHVCPEVYFGRDYAKPFGQHSAEPVNCTDVPEFSSVLTAVLPAQSWQPETINFVIAQIRKLYDIPIITIVPEKAAIDDQGVTIVRYTNESLPEGRFLNQAIRQVKTPYAFIGYSLAHFSNQSSLERMVRVMDELPHVQVVGGAARDLLGHWTYGCLQQRMADYQATYTIGYYYSKYECMYCDDLLAPFSASAELLRRVPFTDKLTGPPMYRDWFAKVREAGHLAMVCPDVMFFLTHHVQMTRDQWKLVASHWALEKIHSYTGEVHEFACKDVGITCGSPLRIIGSFLLPPCCRATMERELGYLVDYGEANGIEYELQSGSALGAVKIGSYLPWDFDHDLVFVRHEYNKWLSMKGPYLEEKKCKLQVTARYYYITVYCPYFFLELYSHANFTSRQYLPVEYRDIPTSIMYAGRRTVVMSNPGLYTRNKLGIDILKHAAHWRTLKVTKIGKAKGGYENPGTWRRCRRPSHHSCQDRYPGDGDLPFMRPFLLL